jgi:hypothetical protein
MIERIWVFIDHVRKMDKFRNDLYHFTPKHNLTWQSIYWLNFSPILTSTYFTVFFFLLYYYFIV